jgi:hypothetical protein
MPGSTETRPGGRALRRDAGQASVELIAGLPALVLAAALAVQLLLVGYAVTIADGRPRRGRSPGPAGSTHATPPARRSRAGRETAPGSARRTGGCVSS